MFIDCLRIFKNLCASSLTETLSAECRYSDINMSRRQIRKITGCNVLPPPDSGSEDDCGPSFNTTLTMQSLYAGLEPSSESSEAESESSTSDSESPVLVKDKKCQKKNKKTKKKCNDLEDDIEKSVREINELLGAPPPVPTTLEDIKEENPFLEVLSIEARHLNLQNEMRRLFGTEQNAARPRRKPQRTLNASKKINFVAADQFEYHDRIGLSMSIVSRSGNTIHFAFDHSPEYQRRHRQFLSQPANYVHTFVDDVLNTHVESRLEVADVLFELEEYSNAYTMTEYVIGMFQMAFHPLFNLNSDIRLEYKYLENRPFHVSLLKYIYLVSNKACHRTALELAKLMMRLDPTDPLAVLFVIDSMALRAREHEWLITASDYWAKSHAAGFLFNVNYSKALATYHVAIKKKENLDSPDKLLKNAILRFPTVALLIKEINKDTPSGMKTHQLFTSPGTGNNLEPLFKLYGKLSSARWREPGVADWMNKNIKALMEEYTNDPTVKQSADYYIALRLSVFRGTPIEVKRHLAAISAMSNLVLDGPVTNPSDRVLRELSTDHSSTINRYNYPRPVGLYNGQ